MRAPTNVGSSPIPSDSFLEELRDDEFRNGFVADHVRTRFALLVRTLREQRGWSQAELGQRLGKPQSVVSRLENPDYGKITLQTFIEVAAAFGLPIYIDMPDWDEWFRLMSDMSIQNLERDSFDIERLQAKRGRQAAPALGSPASLQADFIMVSSKQDIGEAKQVNAAALRRFYNTASSAISAGAVHTITNVVPPISDDTVYIGIAPRTNPHSVGSAQVRNVTSNLMERA